MIEKAPDWTKVIKGEEFEKFLDLITNPESRDFINKFNRDYLYWDKFKHVYTSSLLPKEVAWTFLRVSRNTQIKKIPLRDNQRRNFGYWLPDSFLKELHYLDQKASGQILVDNPDIPSMEKERYLISSLMEEAIASSQLEGAATTRKIAKEMLRSKRKPKNKSEQMIYNNYVTIQKIKELKDKPLTVEMLKGLQVSMTRKTLPEEDTAGRFRTANEGVYVGNLEGTEVLHMPPPANELYERIQKLCKYANDDNKNEFTHPVIKAIILHFWLAYDHPFVDGNGRTARALFYWYMLKSEYWLMEYLSISRVIKRAPAQYYRAFLYSEWDEQDLTYFLQFNLRTIHLAIEELRKYLSRKIKEVKEASSYLVTYPGLNYRQSRLLYHALTHPVASYTIQSHKNTYGITYETARSDLFKLGKKGFLKIVKIGRAYHFYPIENLNRKLKIQRNSRIVTK